MWALIRSPLVRPFYTFELMPYLLLIKKRKFRNAITKLCLSSHQLNIETGRHRNIERLDRKCKICNLGDLEDEYHFTLVCQAYDDLRKQYVPKFYYDKPSVFKFISLLNSTKLKILNNLALYIIKSFELRNTLINERVKKKQKNSRLLFSCKKKMLRNVNFLMYIYFFHSHYHEYVSLFHIYVYSRLSLSRTPRDSLKYFEISVVRHIRFAELSKKTNSINHI